MKKGKGSGKDRDPNEIIDLLKTFYEPEEDEMEEFSSFYDAIDQKLEQQNPVNKVSKATNYLEDNYVVREERLEQFLQRFEKQKNKPKKQAIRFKLKKSSMTILIILILLTLASIASFTSSTKYNYIDIEGEEIDWKILDLSAEQQAKLDEINQRWFAFRDQHEKLIETKRGQLIKEINQELPKFSLIDQYQREILDNEVILKREKLNVFLEKRFVLNEKQSLQLIRQIAKKD